MEIYYINRERYSSISYTYYYEEIIVLTNIIEEFSLWLDGEILKPTHYTVDIISNNLNINDIWAESVTIPGRSIATQERRTFGPQREMPYERLYSGDLDITFMFSAAIGGGGKQIRSKLESWMDEIINPETNVINSAYENYTGSIKISVDYPDGAEAWQIEVDEVYPKTISPVQLGYGINDEYLKQSVSFAFREYKITRG